MQFLRFAIVGSLVALTYILLYLTCLALGMPQMPANALAFLTAVGLQYAGQSWFTFGKPMKDRAQGFRFGVMIGLGLLTAAVITGFVAPTFNLSDAIAAIIVTVVLPFQNYLIMSSWVFKKAGSTPEVSS